MAGFLEFATLVFIGAQITHYCLYPVCVYVIAKIAPRLWLRGPIRSRVSLVVAAYNEIMVIADKIENSLRLDWPNLEVVFVSDGSDDGTTEVIQEHEKNGIVGLIQEQRGGKAKALNRALGEVNGEIIVFSDANAIYAHDAISKLAANFADPSVGCVVGSRKVSRHGVDGEELSSVGRSEGLYWRYEQFIKRNESLVDSTVGISGTMLALRRDAIEPIPEGIINDDVWLALAASRRGYRVIYEPEAICWEKPSLRSQDELKRRKRMIAGRYKQLLTFSLWPWHNARVVIMLFVHKFLRLLMPFLMIGALSANLALLAFPPMAWLMQFTLATQLAFYGLAVIGLIGEFLGKRWRLPALAYFVTVGNYGALVGFFRYLFNKQTVLWEKASR